MRVYMRARVCPRECVRACLPACVCVSASVCVRPHIPVFNVCSIIYPLYVGGGPVGPLACVCKMQMSISVTACVCGGEGVRRVPRIVIARSLMRATN